MINKAIVALLFCSSLISFGQEAWLDSVAIYTEAQAKLDSIDKWQQQVGTARKQKDVDTEMLGLYKILDAKVFDFGNLLRYDEYKEVALLEALIEQYPNNTVTLKIRAGFYDMLGTHIINQRFAKNVIEGIQDMGMIKKAVAHFEKAEKLAKEDKNWYVYYRAKIFRDSNLKGYSAKEIIEQFLKLEDEIKQNKAYNALPRLYSAIAFQYRIQGNNEKSIIYAKKAISKNLRKRRLNQLVNNLSLLYLKMDQPVAALQHSKRSVHLSRAYDTGVKLNSHVILIQAYVRLDSLKKVGHYRKNFDKLIAKHNTVQFTKFQSQLTRAIATNDVAEELKARLEIAQHKLFILGSVELSYLDLLELEARLNEYPKFKETPETLAFYHTIGFLLNYQEKYEESEAYLKKGHELAKKHKEKYKEDYYTISGRLLELYGRMGDKQRTEAFYQQIEKELLSDATLPESISVSIYIEAGLAFHYLKDYSTAISLLNKSIDIDPINPQAHAIQAANYNAISKNDSVIFYGERALLLPNLEFVAPWFAHKALGNTYQRTGAFEKALYHLAEFQRINTNLLSNQTAFKIGIIDKEREQEKAALQAALSNQKLANQRKLLWVLAVGALLFALGLFYIFNRLKIIRKQNIIIAREKQRAEQSERYKEQFLANMSHEIRTPMHAISGMTNALRRQKHPASQTAYLDAIKTSSDNLLVLLNDVLDLSKIESGNLDIVHEPMNVVGVIQQITSLFQYKAVEKGLVLCSNIPKDFPKYIMGDPNRLHQILVNLVGNALKFTDQGSVEINVFRDDNHYTIEVKDSGQGIAPEETILIFESFKQGDTIAKGKQGGTGLGLAISKQLIELQNGKIDVDSQIGMGSRFFFELPLRIAEKGKYRTTVFTEEQLKSKAATLAGISILIAEDNAFNVMVVKDDLEWYIPKVDLTIVDNGQQAMEKFQEKNFDLILMDVQMPVLNGYQATKEIRRLEGNNTTEKPIAIIAMTASLLKEQIDRCYEAGMDAYIPKPYKPEELVNTLLNTLSTSPLETMK
ncbi:ATP-binding protein [Allomuricauda sp. SCSIO 65647]|uniref:tetratricopeptide repeat-containing hybrid sensor histidine kinase/response regulator n=1 Tax=Allomuricauda sp. SCSIO 65647 TaxID=2908843 RepID=UPI001F3B4B70|nr:ATP-binding protein [Muricauda sp. SCSIO 65647]UJH67363.1 ATP-binding protein [Muricauda sp. SCSIO 65647]